MQAEDQESGQGRMVAGATGCTGGDSKLKNPLQVSVTSALSGVSSAGQIALGSTNQTVASASNQALLTPAVLATSYTQVIPSDEVMLTGCVYAMTVTSTLR